MITICVHRSKNRSHTQRLLHRPLHINRIVELLPFTCAWRCFDKLLTLPNVHLILTVKASYLAVLTNNMTNIGKFNKTDCNGTAYLKKLDRRFPQCAGHLHRYWLEDEASSQHSVLCVFLSISGVEQRSQLVSDSKMHRC